jgi:signal transduction histidine kinase
VLLLLLSKLRQKNNLLSRQKEELKQTNTAKDRMFMVIGHDLRGPVWNLRALIELIREEKGDMDSPYMMENFYALSRAVQSVSDLLENLLYWAKSQDGKMTFNPAPTDMNQLVNQSIQPYKSWAEVKNIKINFSQENGALMVNADSNMIQTVIRNLLSNAIKYSFKGGRIDIILSQFNSSCHFSITDSGVGFGYDELKKITDNKDFKQQKGTGNETGSGMGLVLCREFIGRHNSELTVESKKGVGTKFSFDLPILKPSN